MVVQGVKMRYTLCERLHIATSSRASEAGGGCHQLGVWVLGPLVTSW